MIKEKIHDLESLIKSHIFSKQIQHKDKRREYDRSVVVKYTQLPSGQRISINYTFQSLFFSTKRAQGLRLNLVNIHQTTHRDMKDGVLGVTHLLYYAAFSYAGYPRPLAGGYRRLFALAPCGSVVSPRPVASSPSKGSSLPREVSFLSVARGLPL